MSLRGKLLEAGKRGGVLLIAMWLSLLSPAVALAQEAVDAAGSPTGAPENTGAPACTGAGCGQGAGQGANQGADQGGPTLEDLGGTYNDEGNVVLPDGVEDS